MLLEDAFVVRDRAQLCTLFDPGAVLAQGEPGHEARGAEAIGRAAAELWTRERTYVAGTQRVLQARNTALLVSPAGIHVARRGDDGAWRVAICLLRSPDNPNTQEDG